MGAGRSCRFDGGVRSPGRKTVQEIEIDDQGTHQRIGPFFGAVRNFFIRMKVTYYRTVIARTRKHSLLSQ